jgi:ubiquinone/menaquinone biosynthesis C-methylase UbiE
MLSEQKEFWSTVAQKYDQVVDLQIGPATRSMVRERVAKESRLGKLVEFGCGTGFYTEVLVGKADSVVASDISSGMLALAKERIKAGNLTFQMEDCQKTTLPDGAFDTAFISLVIHFTVPEKTLAEMRRILKPGGALIIANLDPGALNGLNRLRCLVRILYHGLKGYRVKPPKGLGKNIMTQKQLCDLLVKSGFRVAITEIIKDPSRSSNISVEYIRAVRL